jgi:hypothetical protein
MESEQVTITFRKFSPSKIKRVFKLHEFYNNEMRLCSIQDDVDVTVVFLTARTMQYDEFIPTKYRINKAFDNQTMFNLKSLLGKQITVTLSLAYSTFSRKEAPVLQQYTGILLSANNQFIVLQVQEENSLKAIKIEDIISVSVSLNGESKVMSSESELLSNTLMVTFVEPVREEQQLTNEPPNVPLKGGQHIQCKFNGDAQSEDYLYAEESSDSDCSTDQDWPTFIGAPHFGKISDPISCTVNYETNQISSSVLYSFTISEDGKTMDIEMKLVINNESKVQLNNARVTLITESIKSLTDNSYQQVMLPLSEVTQYDQNYRSGQKRLVKMSTTTTTSALKESQSENNFEISSNTPMSDDVSESSSPEFANILKLNYTTNIFPESKYSVSFMNRKGVTSEIREIYDPEQDPYQFTTELIWRNIDNLPSGKVAISKKQPSGEILDLGTLELLPLVPKDRVKNLLPKALGITAEWKTIGTSIPEKSNEIIQTYSLKINNQSSFKRKVIIRKRFNGTNWKNSQLGGIKSELEFVSEELPDDEKRHSSAAVGVCAIELQPKSVQQYTIHISTAN